MPQIFRKSTSCVFLHMFIWSAVSDTFSFILLLNTLNLSLELFKWKWFWIQHFSMRMTNWIGCRLNTMIGFISFHEHLSNKNWTLITHMSLFFAKTLVMMPSPPHIILQGFWAPSLNFGHYSPFTKYFHVRTPDGLNWVQILCLWWGRGFGSGPIQCQSVTIQTDLPPAAAHV